MSVSECLYSCFSEDNGDNKQEEKEKKKEKKNNQKKTVQNKQIVTDFVFK